MDYWNIYPRQARMVDRILAANAAGEEKVFFYYHNNVYTYQEVNERVNQVANKLFDLGVRPGDKVCVMMPGCPEYLYLWFALARIGAVEVPINNAYRGDLLEYIINNSDSILLVVEASLVSRIVELQEALAGLKEIIVADVFSQRELAEIEGVGRLSKPCRAFGELFTGDTAPPNVAVSYTDPVAIIYTSGTTGPSKGVILTQHMETSFGLFHAEIMQYTEKDVAYNYLPFFHIAAKFVTIACMLVKAPMVLTERFSVSSFWDDVHRYGVTLFVAVGGVCHMLYSQPPREDDARNTVRAVYAVPAPAEFYHEFEKRFGLKLVEAYGATEFNLVTYTGLDESPVGSCGRASPYFEVKIVDAYDRDVPSGTAGEIVVRPKEPFTLTPGYYKMPDKTIETIRNLWFHTGDRGYQDANGYFYFLDRLKDAIRRRGENISSYEIERTVNSHPAVSESAAIAVPSELGEDEIKVCVVLKPGHTLTPEELIEHCAARMAYFMVPRFIEFKPELPRTPTEKVKKFELRAEGDGGITAATWDREKAGIKITRDGQVTQGSPGGN